MPQAGSVYVAFVCFAHNEFDTVNDETMNLSRDPKVNISALSIILYLYLAHTI